ncbi:MAG: hypothetical protein KAI99_08375, partial [Cyclobacteriaceae bacterium]|nr:hypothetical protein [Cyclobacteriaceae bacterium]
GDADFNKIIMSNQVNIDQHKKILGTLFIVFSLLNFVMVLMFALIASAVIPMHVHDFEVLLAVKIVKYAVFTLTFILTTPALIAGIGLLYKKDWALTLALIIGIVGILGFPIWTFIGIYSIVIFILAQNNQKTRNASDLVASD